MKTVLLSAYYPPKTMGGAEISTHLLARGLVEKGNEVRVITVGDMEEEIRLDAVNVMRLKIPLKEKPLFEQRHSKKSALILDQVGRYLKDADIIHANDFRSVMALLEWKDKQEKTPPIIATIRDYAQISGSTNFINAEGELPANSIEDARESHRIKEAGRVRRFFRWWQYRYNINYRKEMFKKLDGQVFISGSQMELTEKHQDLKKMRKTVIYNPMDDSYLDEKLVRGHDGAVLFVGRVEDYKGVRLLLDAWQDVIKKVPEAYLKIIGEGVDKKDYERLVENNGMRYKVSIHGKVQWDRLMRIYDEAQVVVAPHIWYEPFGRTVAEAMARGKVVVTANVGGPSEMIENNKSGIIFERKSKNSLVEALLRALGGDENIQKDIGREASNWVRDNLRKRDIAIKYENFYKEVIDNKIS